MKTPSDLLKFILAAALLLAGCISPEDARLAKTRQLRRGMTAEEVEKLMGRPHSTESIMLGTNTKEPWQGLVWKYWGLRLIFQDPEKPVLNSWITK